jgi:uncharacterized protein
MSNKEEKINRRNLLKSAGVAGLGGILAAAGAKAAEPNIPDGNTPVPPLPIPYKIPTRKLGKTGAQVPILSLGLGRPTEPVVLNQALDWGVYHWDTSLIAANGNSEIGIGEFIAKNPARRKDVFLVTKESKSNNPDDIEKCLQTSLKRLSTDYIDLYMGVYMASDMVRFTDDVKKWAENAKKRGVIKYFGFTTHQNMPQCLMSASKLGWVDAIMTSYNFRLAQDKQMQDAIDACDKAGIGLIAMKTQGMRQRNAPADPNADEADKKMLAHFLEKGFTDGQAKIKAVLDDKRFCTVNSAMNTTAMLMTNVAAVMDKTRLTQKDMEVLKKYAEVTCSGYCAGCAHICEPLASGAPVADIMRALMYHDSYGQVAEAKTLFAQATAQIKERLLSMDFSKAEARCPNHMPIGKLIADAANRLA